MSRKKEAIIMGIGILTGIALCGPAAQAATETLIATLSSQAIYVDGQQVSMTAYAIGGNNYVKLRDVAEAVDFNAYWDGKAVRIESDKPYTGEAPAGQTSQPSTASQGVGDDYLANGKPITEKNVLELVSGLRKGELVALLWDDLDIQNRTISVSKQYIKNPSGKLTLSRPKTETSVRRVSIPQEAVDLLVREHEKHPDNPYMFPSSTTGEMYYPDSVVKLHEKILKDAGLEHIRFHDLRHTFATLALQNGVDIKTVSSMLGHYDAGFTLRTYTHATRQMQDRAAETMGSFMAQVM